MSGSRMSEPDTEQLAEHHARDVSARTWHEMTA